MQFNPRIVVMMNMMKKKEEERHRSKKLIFPASGPGCSFSGMTIGDLIAGEQVLVRPGQVPAIARLVFWW